MVVAKRSAAVKVLRERVASAVWPWRHAALLRRIDRGAVRTRVEHGWVQIAAAVTNAPTLRAQIWILGRPEWLVEFGAEHAPAAGVREAQIVFVEAVAWPVLAHTVEGLILPRAEPRRIQLPT